VLNQKTPRIVILLTRVANPLLRLVFFNLSNYLFKHLSSNSDAQSIEILVSTFGSSVESPWNCESPQTQRRNSSKFVKKPNARNRTILSVTSLLGGTQRTCNCQALSDVRKLCKSH
jgi:hypothetical protein